MSGKQTTRFNIVLGNNIDKISKPIRTFLKFISHQIRGLGPKIRNLGIYLTNFMNMQSHHFLQQV